MAHFFVSYNKADRNWAEWIAWQLEEAGYTTVIQAWDFPPGTNFVAEMQGASTTADSTIAVLSPDYLNESARFSQAEWMTAFAKDPTGQDAALIPVRVRACEPQGLLSILQYIDLVGLKPPAAKQKLLVGIQAALSAGRAKPVTEPSFPGIEEGSPQPPPPPERSIRKMPDFPGPRTIWDPLLELVDTRLGARGRLLVSIVALAFVVVPAIVPLMHPVLEVIRSWQPTPPLAPTPGLVKADPNRFSIAIAQLGNDEVGYRNTIVQELGNQSWLEVLPIDRRIEASGPVQSDAIKAGHEQARKFLNENGAQVLIWGTVVGKGMNNAQLYWTPREQVDVKGTKTSERYPLATDLNLPQLFWEDLRKIIGLLVLTQAAAEISEQDKGPSSEQLRAFVTWVRELVGSHTLGWGASEHGQVLFILGNGLTRLGEQGHNKGDIDAAVDMYRHALAEFQENPAALARTQHNLCVALRMLGELTRETETVEQAVQACQAALPAYTTTETRRDWAMTQNNLGNAWLRLGELRAGTEDLANAETAYRAALTVYTQAETPLSWAITQNNLGLALQRQGERERETTKLPAAVDAYRAALTTLETQDAPLYRAMANTNLCNALTMLAAQNTGSEELQAAVHACQQAGDIYKQMGRREYAAARNNLGNALTMLGERERGTATLQQAVDAYRDALAERPRNKSGLEWAATKSNLCNALAALGERETDTANLKSAVQECDQALLERTRSQFARQWAATQTNRCRALQALGERENAIPRLQDGLAACRGALEVQTQAAMPLQWAETNFYLGNVLYSLGKRASGVPSLRQAEDAYGDALKERTREVAPLDWGLTLDGLGNVQRLVSERTEDAGLACTALASHAQAWSVLRGVPAFTPEAGTATIRFIDTTFGAAAHQQCAQKQPDIFAIFQATPAAVAVVPNQPG